MIHFMLATMQLQRRMFTELMSDRTMSLNETMYIRSIIRLIFQKLKKLWNILWANMILLVLIVHHLICFPIKFVQFTVLK